MNTLETLGFTKETGLDGLSSNNVAVSLHWSGEEAVVAVDGKQVFVSESEEEIIAFVKSVIVSNNEVESNEAKEIAQIVAQDDDMKYYGEETARGQDILIKDILTRIGKKVPKSVSFSDFKKLVEGV